MDLYEKYELTRVINACGKMTHLSGAVVLPDIAAQANAALSGFFDLEELQQRAGATIARWSGAEWGCVTACTAAGISLGIAACMTGKDAGRIAQLPATQGMKNQVVLQKGHAVNFGAPVAQTIRLAGAEIVEIGTINNSESYQLEHAINDQTAAVFFVVSHHTVRYGCIPLEEVVAIAHGRGVPVVVDGAAQSFQMSKIIDAGVDLAICSGHKYLSGTTAGIVCGRRDLIEAVVLQNRGIGRPMKVGKEGIFGAMAALEHRMEMDVSAWQAEQDRKMHTIIERLGGIAGVQMSVEHDANGNPFSRARLDVDLQVAGINAKVLSRAVADGSPSIRLRAHHVDEGYVMIDAIEMNDAEVEVTCQRLEALLNATDAEKTDLLTRYGGGGETLPAQLTWLRDPKANVRHITGV
jgi:D-glucosaminate-6-phosphate ammonia-lyase